MQGKTLSAALIVLGVGSTSVRAQAGLSEPGDSAVVGQPQDHSKWSWSIRPYFFLAGVSGSITSGALTLPINSSFSDILSHLQPSAFASVTAERGRWGGYGDFEFISLKGEGTGVAGSTLKLENVIGEADLTFRPTGATSLKFVGGVRVYSVDQKLKVGNQPEQSSTTTVFDPVVGAMGDWALGSHWNFEIRGDLGGFGVGSEFTNQLAVVFLWRISDSVRLPFGYRVLGYQIDHGGVLMNTRMGGLVVGADFQL